MSKTKSLVNKSSMSQDSKLSCVIFWNVNNMDLTSAVCSLANSTMADVVVLIENKVLINETLCALQKNVSADFYIPYSSPGSRFHCFCRSRALDMSEVHSSSRTSVRKSKIGPYKVLLALVHGPDIRNYDAETRQEHVHAIASMMSLVKKNQATNKMVLLGDFNMNPYERGMILASGLNAMMTRKCVEPGFRQHLKIKYDFYYNPMWSLFGDNSDGPAGTIYDISNQGPYGWSMLDQVVIHHSIVPFFRDVKILTEAGEQSLMDGKGRPDAKNASDHFPILVNFSGENNE